MTNTAILLSTFNGEKFLSQQLDSILQQDYNDFILYVRDDCSIDSTMEILLSYQRKFDNIIILDNNNLRLGAKSSFYYLLKNVEAKFYFFCDQDDIWKRDKMSLQIDKIESLDHISNLPIVIFHDLSLINESSDLICDSFWERHKFQFNNINLDSFYVQNKITGCTCLINESMKMNMLKFNPDDILMHDHVISLIAYGFGKAICMSSKLVLYRDHNSSVTSKTSVSYHFRFFNFLNNLNRYNYLHSHINQLDAYLKLFGKNLKEKEVNNINRFISLRNVAPIFRFLSLKMYFNKS